MVTGRVLIALVQNWRKDLDNKAFNGAILIDFSKAFGTVNHDLLIAKFHMVFNMTL